jgi:site-specific recombinase XerD
MSQQEAITAVKVELTGVSYENFIGTIQSDATRSTYDHRMKAFLTFHKMGNPDELIRFDPKTLENKITAYINYLKKQNKSRSSIAGVVAPLVKFFVMNDIELKWKKIHANLPKAKLTIQDKAWKHDHIRKMLEVATKVRMKVVILLLASTGMRIGGLVDLKMKNLEPVDDLYQITVYQLDPEMYITFCTPECRAMIDKYIEFRRNSGEVITDESPVIRDDFDRDDIGKAKNARPMGVEGMKSMVEDIVVLAGLKQKHINHSQRTEIMRAHGFRKFFETNIDRAKVQESQIEKLMGWGSKRGLRRNYNRREIEELLQSYAEAIPYLTINEETRLKSENTELKQKDNEIEQLKSQMAEMQQTLKDMYQQGVLKKG